MIIGYNEAMMMKEEKLIKGAGDSLNDFFGLSNVKIVGILKPTGTIIDDYHFVSLGTLERMSTSARVEYVPEKEIIKSFYFVEGGNAPEKLKNDIKGFEAQNINSQSYLPVYIGSAEAQMMIDNKLISKPGDVIDNFFGNKVVIASILPKTGTALDMMHFVGPGFELKP